MAQDTVTLRHPAVARHLAWWTRCRDVYAGSDTVKAKTTTYLPSLEGVRADEEAYRAYLSRAMFYPAFERTVAGLTGAVIRKPPTIVAPESVAGHLDDVTLNGTPLSVVARLLLQELLVVGRAAILVDWDDRAGRPRWTFYSGEALTNWHEQYIDGHWDLDLAVLEETVDDREAGAFESNVVTQYRTLRVIDEALVVEVWRKITRAGAEPDWVSVEQRDPARGGVRLRRIPLVVVAASGLFADPVKPPLLDLVDLNLSHYRSSADLEHGRHFTALPTPYVTGWAGDAAGEPLRIGSGAAWIIPNEQAKVGMLEFTGTGLKALEVALEQKEKLMATVGARLLEQQPRQAETAEAVRLRQAGEHAALSTIVDSASQALTLALQWHAWWVGVDALASRRQDVEVQLSRDFSEAGLAAQEAAALMQLWQAEAISYKTLYFNLQQGEWARPGVTWEEERADLEAEGALEEEAAADLLPPPRPPTRDEVDAAMVADDDEPLE